LENKEQILAMLPQQTQCFWDQLSKMLWSGTIHSNAK